MGRYHMWTGRVSGLTLLCSALAGTSLTAQQTIRDSAGVRIVESRAPHFSAADRFWQVSAKPSLEIGRAEGEDAYLFTSVVGIVSFSDGSIAIAEGRAAEIRLFDLTGKHLVTTGRSGAGPGEFRDLRGMWRFRGDSLLAFDNVQQKVQVFDSKGHYVRDFRLNVRLDYARFHYLADLHHVLGVTTDGDIVVETPHAVPRTVPTGPTYATTTLLRFDALGVGPDTLVTVPVQWLQIRSATPVVGTSALFTTAPIPAIAQEKVFSGTGDRPEVRRYSAAGRLEAIYRWNSPLVSVEAPHVAQERDRRLALLPSPSTRSRMLEILDQSPVPATFPAYIRLLPDRIGNLWLEGSTIPGTTQPVWTVLDAEGRWLGAIRLPAGLRPYEITDQHVLGVLKDQDGVPRVQRYHLQKG